MIEVEFDDYKLLAYLDSLPDAVREKLSGRLLGFAIHLQSYVRATKLSGNPLHHRSGNLIDSINYLPEPIQTPDSVEEAVGTNLVYGRVHEKGGAFLIPAHTRAVTMAFGRPIEPVEAEVRAHVANYPQRAFLAPSLEENRGEFMEAVSEAVKEAIGAA